MILLPLSVAFLVCDPVTAENVTIRQVVLSTDEVPGGGATFGDLRAPSINAHGAIAFEDGFGSAIYTTAHGRAVGRLIRVVGQGDVPPGVVGSFGAAYEPSLNDNGSFAFRAEGQDSCNRGIYFFVPPGTLKLVADASTRRPGTRETFAPCGPSTPMASGGGQIVFADATDSTRGVYRAHVHRETGRKLSLSELVVLEDGFVDVANGGNPHSINDSGVVAMVLQRLDFTRGIYLARPDGSLRPIVVEGNPAPGGGNFTSNLGTPSVNATNEIAFGGDFEGDFGSGFGIFVASPNGRITKVVNNRIEVPNHPETFFNGFFGIHLADDRTIIFQGRYNLNGLDFQGLYKKSSVGLEVIFDQFDGLVVNGEHISLVDEGRVLDMFLAARFADVVDDTPRVAFLQELPPGGGSPRSGIFVAVQR